MLFRRRHPLRFHQKLNHFMWPKRGWSRALRYYFKRLMRLSGSPHSIAIGFGAGVALAMTPFLGFHYLLSFVIAFLVRGNVLATVVGTTIGNPLTFPFIWFATFETGNMILGWFGQTSEHLSIHELTHQLLGHSMHTIWPIIEPMLIGAVPIGLIMGTIGYVGILYAAEAFQTSRRERFAIRRHELHGRHF